MTYKVYVLKRPQVLLKPMSKWLVEWEPSVVANSFLDPICLGRDFVFEDCFFAISNFVSFIFIVPIT